MSIIILLIINPMSCISLILLCPSSSKDILLYEVCNFTTSSAQSQTDHTCSYAVMRDCWLAEPGLRPSFAELAEKIASVLTDGSKGVSRVLVDDVVVLCGGGLVVC